MTPRYSTADLTWMIQKETDACIEWPGSRFPNGYGKVYIHEGNLPMVHRWVYQHVHHLSLAELPEDVRHTCKNPPCVNPRHLFGTTHLEAIQDRDRNNPHVMTVQEVRDARRRFAAGEPITRISKSLNRSHCVVWGAIRRRNFRWVDPLGLE